MTTDEEHLQWMLNRLAEVHGEHKGVDYMVRMQQIIDSTKTELNLHLVSKRYFAVNYVANSHDGQITGLIDITTNGNYLNREMTLVNITEKIDGLSNIVITSTNEMSEEDFKTWQS